LDDQRRNIFLEIFFDSFQVDTWDGPQNEPHHVVVNTEWGAFGDKGELDFILVRLNHVF